MVFPISGFTAVPNPVMLSFMGAQSFIMMYMAGEAWQFGKRKISAMTNEEFNKLTPIELLKQQQSTLKQAIPSMEQSMKDMTPMFETITAEMLKAIPPIVKAVGDVLPGVVEETGQILTGQIGGLTGQAKIDYDTQAFEGWNQFWKAMANSIPNLPSAGASTGGNLSTGGNFTLSTFGPEQTGDKIVINPILNPSEITNISAAQKQAAHNAEVKRLALLKLQQETKGFELPKNLDIHKQATQQFKPKAGQTQTIERNRLIKKLTLHNMALKKWKNMTIRNQADRNKQKLMIQRNQVLVINTQKVLTQLLTRYRW